jgi:hypothetical protein
VTRRAQPAKINQAAKDAALERNRQFHERILAVARWPDRARN